MKIPRPVQPVACFGAAALLLWTAFSGYRNGAMELGESASFIFGRKEQPKRFWVALISPSLLGLAFAAVGVYLLSSE
jgi:hypothetical protein